MFECFVDDDGGVNDAANRVVCCSGLMGHEDGRGEFNRHWLQLLMKHELPSLHLKEWRQIAESKGWDARKRRAVLSDFVRIIEQHDLLEFVVAVDTAVWNSIDRERRAAFGSASEFCSQRLTRLVIDQLEAAKTSDLLAIICEKNLREFSRRTNSLKKMMKMDTRAMSRVGSIQFSDPKSYCQLQAASLLNCMTQKEFAKSSCGRLEMPPWLRKLKELPAWGSDGIREYWDRQHVDRCFATIEWDVSER